MREEDLMPREKLILQSPSALSDAELLAILLRTGKPGLAVVDLADHLLDRFGGVSQLLNASMDEWLACPGIGLAKYVTMAASLELSRRYLLANLERGEAMSDPVTTIQFLQLTIGSSPREIFSCLFLDNQHRLIRYEELFLGTIDGASVHPREVVRRGLELNAAAVIFAHNHPSGVSEPSQADRRITERLRSALSLVDIRVLDHIVVGCGEATSFAERGYL